MLIAIAGNGFTHCCLCGFSAPSAQILTNMNREQKLQNSTVSQHNSNEMLAVRAALPDNCTRKEALLHFGFVEVGTKSIRGNKYSNCMYNEKLNVFAVPFVWRTSYHSFMSRDEKVQSSINKLTSEMWYGVDVIRNFNNLSNYFGVSMPDR